MYTYAAVFGVALLVLAAPLAGVTLLDFHATQLKSTADEEVDSVLQTPQYDEFETESVEVTLDDDYPLRSVEQVVITVSGPDTERVSELTNSLYEAVTTRVDEDVVVEVQVIVADRRGDQSPDYAGESPGFQPSGQVSIPSSAFRGHR